MVKTAVVILNYNGKAYLEQFLPSVISYSGDAQIVVADNGSTDDSLVFLQAKYPQIKCLAFKENYGFCGGYNKALQQIEATYYVLLNSDVEVTENWLSPLVGLLDADAQMAACQPKMLAYHDKNRFEHAGAAGGFIDILGYPFCRGRLFDSTEVDQGQYNDVLPVFWATGACLCIRANLYHEMGGLDEMFFAHMEEIDLCWRLQRAGHTIAYCGHSHVYHVGGGTLQQSNPKKTFLNFRNGLFLLYKNLPTAQLIPIIFIRMLLDGVAGVQFLLKGKFPHLIAILKAHFAFYGALGKLQKKRRSFAHLGNGTPLSTIYPQSLVKAYFLQGKKTFKELNWK